MQHERIRKMIHDGEAIWDKLIPKILKAYGVIPNVSGTSPFFMMYGRDPILPINTLL